MISTLIDGARVGGATLEINPGDARLGAGVACDAIQIFRGFNDDARWWISRGPGARARSIS